MTEEQSPQLQGLNTVPEELTYTQPLRIWLFGKRVGLCRCNETRA